MQEKDYDSDYYMLPKWAKSKSSGKYMERGAQLQTRDGRVLGNAYVDEVYFDESLKEFIAVCYTEAGNDFIFNNGELKECFYPPIYILNIDKVRNKFKPERKQEDKQENRYEAIESFG